jgi:UDP-3-O-[3-hydroxymyristoyl] N-acetylglucosamine deacetylase / 3-hydroxyacyl-[acyl-carrier-protein] dehydratase
MSASASQNGLRQHTLAGVTRLEGIGVHSGERSVLTFRPAEVGTGIRFQRTDLEGAPVVPADLAHVAGTDLGTTLALGEARVLTVEHVLAALAGAGVDNALLELEGPEPPILDGSFQPFLDAIDGVGLEEQDEPAEVIEVKGPVCVTLGAGVDYVATPAEGLRVSATIDFDHPLIGRQFGSFVVDPAGFRRDLATARTFGFSADADRLRARGLARGSSLENSVVLDDTNVLNEGGLRSEDEFLRHKVGDLVGDLKLLGARVRGHVVAERPSHQGNVALARALADHALHGAGQAILDAAKIMQYLPHRYPMLLVDRIVGYEPGKRIVGIKNVTINEPFFQGHYPGHPIMPGVLIIEAMAQVGGLLLMDYVDDPDNKVVYFMSLDNVKWRRPVTPGDQLVFELEMVQFRRHVCRMRGVGRVEGQVVAEAELMARVMDR